MVKRKNKNKRNKGGATFTDLGLSSDKSPMDAVMEDDTLNKVSGAIGTAASKAKDLVVKAVLSDGSEQVVGGRRKRQKGGDLKEDLIGKPVGKETCHMDIRKPSQKGGNKNKYQGCGGDVFKGLYGGSKRKSRRKHRSRKRRGGMSRRICSCKFMGKTPRAFVSETLNTENEQGQLLSSKEIQKNVSYMPDGKRSKKGGRRRRTKRRTKRRKGRRRRKSRRKSRRRRR